MSYARAFRDMRWLLVIAVLVLLGACTFLYHRLQAYSGKVAAQQQRLLRLEVRDALLATHIPEHAMVLADGSEKRAEVYKAGRPHVIWVVNMNRCVQCLEQLGEWRQIRQRTEVRTVVILEGVGRRGARRIVRETGLAGTVLVDSLARWRQEWGPDEWPGMTVLGVSASGSIRTVAARTAGRASCRWSPFVHAQELIVPP